MSETKSETKHIDNDVEKHSSLNINSDGVRAIQGDAVLPEQTYSNENNLPPGFHSIQGLSATELDGKNAGIVYPRDAGLGTLPPLSRSAANDLSLAGQHAESTKATRAHTDHPQGVPVEYWRIRSEIGEHIAQQNIAHGLRADQFSKNGSNFPGYDVLGKDELCSVKVFSWRSSQKEGQDVLQPRYDQYRQEFADLISPESKQNKLAAERLWNLKQTETWNDLKEHLPPEVVSSQSELEMVQAISTYSTMRIPEDQVEDVRHYLMKEFDMSNEDVCKRVNSIDQRFATSHYQSKAAELWMKRQEEIASLRKRSGGNKL